jgi:hypothetical protein
MRDHPSFFMINVSKKLTRVCNYLIIKYVDILFDNAYINKNVNAHILNKRVFIDSF